jgi:acetylglutamate kinase
MTSRRAAQLIRIGTANKGMVAKLQACRAAVAGGVRDVVIASGRTTKLDMLATDAAPTTGCTQVVR